MQPGRQPTDCPPRPRRARGFRGPVRWLLGWRLLVGLKQIAMATAYGEKLDHRDWMTPRAVPFTSDGPEFWFDYMADTGDGQMPMYNLAYLVLQDLWASDGAAGVGSAPAGATALPRGRFLFIGGDTAYHIADHATLRERLVTPFCWAAEQLGAGVERRPLFGIPGNHDHYDALHGFNRQFRRSLWPSGSGSQFDRTLPEPPLDLAPFVRCQDASYVALQLPFDWWLWGIDTQHGQRLDFRQQHFFDALTRRSGGTPPARLIVATPEPTTVFGRPAAAAGSIAAIFSSLRLERPFLAGERLPRGRVRLDLAGDVHHYTRYWGPKSALAAGAPAAENYASVVAGLGGAFLHPSYTRLGDLQPQALFPSAADARARILPRLFSPWAMFSGGLVWLFAALAAGLVGAGVAAEPTRAVLERLPFVGTLPTATAGGLATFAAAVQAAPSSAPAAAHAVAAALCLLAALLSPALVLWHVPEERMRVRPRFGWAFAAAHLPTAVLLGLALCILARAPGGEPTRSGAYVASLLVAGAWGGLIGVLSWARGFADELTRQARHRDVPLWEHWPAWLVSVWGVVLVALVHVRYGQAPVAAVAFNALFTTALASGTLGLGVLAVVAGAGGRRWPTRLGFAGIGLWHGILQTVLPLLIGLYASLPRVVGVALLLAAGSIVGSRLAVRDRRAALLALWGALGLAAALVVSVGASAPSPLTGGVTVRVALAGAVLGPIWFGWYLAVTSLFNGHNNEAGGAARVEQCKQFVRIRLTAEGLSAWVIGFDEPLVDATQLRQPGRVRLIDVFHLRP